MNPRTVGLMMAVVTGICWATLAIALRQAYLHASTGTIVWFRMIVPFGILVAFYGFREPRQLKKLLPKPLILVAGLCLAANYFAYMRGIELTSASNAQIMIQMGPLSLLVIGILYFKESPSRSQLIGLILAVFGFSLFFWDQILLSVADAPKYLRGDLWLVFAAVTWAVFAALQKGLRGNWSPQQFNMVIYGVCALALWPTANMAEMSRWDTGVWLLMLFCAFNTLVAYGAFAEALKRAPASHVSLILAANPLLTIFLVMVMAELGIHWISPEPIAWRGLLGALFVVSGVALTVLPDPRRFARRKTSVS